MYSRDCCRVLTFCVWQAGESRYPHQFVYSGKLHTKGLHCSCLYGLDGLPIYVAVLCAAALRACSAGHVQRYNPEWHGCVGLCCRNSRVGPCQWGGCSFRHKGALIAKKMEEICRLVCLFNCKWQPHLMRLHYWAFMSMTKVRQDRIRMIIRLRNRMWMRME